MKGAGWKGLGSIKFTPFSSWVSVGVNLSLSNLRLAGEQNCAGRLICMRGLSLCFIRNINWSGWSREPSSARCPANFAQFSWHCCYCENIPVIAASDSAKSLGKSSTWPSLWIISSTCIGPLQHDFSCHELLTTQVQLKHLCNKTGQF